MGRVQDKVALITGGASGIGLAAATLFAEEGASVVVADRDEAAGRSAAAALARASFHRLDVTREDDWIAVTDAVVRDHGRLDILVNSAGVVLFKDIEATTLDEWRALMAVNLDGTFLFTNAVVPAMQRQGRGKIVNLASIAGRGRSVSSSAAYATAKGGIIALTKKLSYELGPYGININAIAPSVTLTERIRPHWLRRSQEDQARAIDNTPLRRVAEAVDQARVICFLASEDADFVTGETIDVTGGGS